jgi:4-hydroxy-3-polyprenylbenzoate decarboxylase
MSLREYISQHRSLSEVDDICDVVDPDTQLGAQVRARMHNPPPPIMYFRNIEGTSFSVVANLFATTERLNRLLTQCDKSLSLRLEELPSSVVTWSDFCDYIRLKYACSQVFDSEESVILSEIDSLYDLPQVRCWAGDTRAYFPLPTVFTRAIDSREINAGIYRLSPINSRAMTLNWRRGSNAYKMWRNYANQGKKMPLTVAMGVDPALTFASMFPLPGVGTELALWGFIRGCAQRLRYNREGLPFPLDAEIVMEGYVDPYQLHEEGGYANHTGFYTESVPCPVMHIDNIRAREGAIMPITLVGPPPTENALLGTTIWQHLFVYIRREIPFLLHLSCPAETAYLPLVVLQVKSPKSASEWNDSRRIILQHPILRRVHTLVLVDENTDISTFKLIYWHCMNLGLESYFVADSGMRVVDGVLWQYQGKRKVLPFENI